MKFRNFQSFDLNDTMCQSINWRANRSNSLDFARFSNSACGLLVHETIHNIIQCDELNLFCMNRKDKNKKEIFYTKFLFVLFKSSDIVVRRQSNHIDYD